MGIELSSATLRHKLRVDERFRSLRSLGWPVLSGVCLVLVGIFLMVISQRLQVKQDALQVASLKADSSIQKPASELLRPMPALLPNSSDYTADLSQIFDIAKSQGIVLMKGDYHEADPISIAVDVRVVDLHFNENYTKLKEFLAAVLNTMPHAAVQQLRIERKDSIATRHDILLQLALVYSSDQARTQPQLPAQQVLSSQPIAGKKGLQP